MTPFSVQTSCELRELVTAKYSNRKLVAILHNLTSVRHEDPNYTGGNVSNERISETLNFEKFLSSQPKCHNCINRCGAIGLCQNFVLEFSLFVCFNLSSKI